MKFSSTHRDDFLPVSYNPGPGHYSQVQQTIERKASHSKLKDPWAKTKQTTPKNSLTPGPGAYFGNPPWETKAESKAGLMQFFTNPRKIVTIPSIPANKNGLGYIEREDGFLVPLEDPTRKSDKEVGPGTYNTSYRLTQKRVKGGYISQNPRIEENTKEDDSKTEEDNLDTVDEFRNTQPMEQKSETKPKKSKSMKQLMEEEAEKQRRKEILMEEKEIPGPGAYYNEKHFSAFKVKKKDNGPTVFAGSLPRQDIARDNGVPGPGSYEQVKELKTPQKDFLSFGEVRFKDIVPDLPGPGSYNIPTTLRGSELHGNDFVSYPSAFGSGVKRFNDQNDSAPGPGHYNPKNPQKKKLLGKKYKTFVIPSMILGGGQNKDHALLGFDPLDNPSPNKTKSDMSRTKASKSENKGNPVFTSNVDRFAKIKPPTNLGPGAYRLKSDFDKKNGFIASTFGTEKRAKSQPKDIYSIRLGPGRYDYDPGVTKENRNYSVRINPEPQNFKF